MKKQPTTSIMSMVDRATDQGKFFGEKCLEFDTSVVSSVLEKDIALEHSN